MSLQSVDAEQTGKLEKQATSRSFPERRLVLDMCVVDLSLLLSASMQQCFPFEAISAALLARPSLQRRDLDFSSLWISRPMCLGCFPNEYRWPYAVPPFEQYISATYFWHASLGVSLAVSVIDLSWSLFKRAAPQQYPFKPPSLFISESRPVYSTRTGTAARNKRISNDRSTVKHLILHR